MKPMIRAGLAVFLLLGALSSAWAQASRFVGTWLVEIHHSKRPRAMIVTQQGETLRARFGSQESGTRIGLATAVLDDGGTLTLTTNSESVAVLKVVDDNTLQGTFTPRAGKQSNLTAIRSTPEALAALAAPGAANAVAPNAAPRSFLPKAEIEALALGKKWSFRRTDSGDHVRWDLREGGALFGNNNSTNQKDAGTWTVNDQGHLCLKWRGGSTDRCVALMREGDQLKLVDAVVPGPGADLTVE
ncbi:MAG: hypothetical protein ABI281_00820 [Caldimonas sp.]